MLGDINVPTLDVSPRARLGPSWCAGNARPQDLSRVDLHPVRPSLGVCSERAWTGSCSVYAS